MFQLAVKAGLSDREGNKPLVIGLLFYLFSWFAYDIDKNNMIDMEHR